MSIPCCKQGIINLGYNLGPILSILHPPYLSGIWHHFFEDFIYFSAGAFAECQRRLARNGITENFKNMDITADICKKQTHYLLSIAACHDDDGHAIRGHLPKTPLDAPFSQYLLACFAVQNLHFGKNAKSCQELPRIKSQRTQTSELQATIC